MVDTSNEGIIWGTISAGVMAALGILYRAWSRLRVASSSDETETHALALLNQAVNHWKGLYEDAWEQAKKERQMREAAETKLASVVDVMERLRGEVAELERKVDALRSELASYTTQGRLI